MTGRRMPTCAHVTGACMQVPMANISLYYYAGTSYLMLRRYIDAGRCFSSVLSFIDRVKKSYQCAPSVP